MMIKKIYEYLKNEKNINISYNERKDIIEYSFDIIIDDISELKSSDIESYEIYHIEDEIRIKLIDLENYSGCYDHDIFSIDHIIFENKSEDLEIYMISNMINLIIKNQIIRLSNLD